MMTAMNGRSKDCAGLETLKGAAWLLKRSVFLAGLVGLGAGLALPVRADSTWVYAVQISATVQLQPAQITLSWEPDQYGANSYTIYRKTKTASSWGSPIAVLAGSVSNYTDANVVAGSTYEYQIIKAATLGYSGYGYIYSGIQAALTESRGKLVLVVGTNSTGPLSAELGRLQSDLVGDGWQVIRHDISSNQTPDAVRSLIIADYNADPANVQAVFLFGPVPVLQSGFIDYDTHGARPMPADPYYGEMNNDWPTNSETSPSFLPSDVKLMVGRVDFSNMPGNGAPTAWPNETELLRNYLNKDHKWRFKQISVKRRALMANRFGDLDGEARAATGYRNFEPFVGPGNTLEADISDTAAPANRWISLLSADSYLWTYGCGGGQDTSISELGLHGQYNDVWSTDIVAQDPKAVFYMLEGSHFGNWDHADNIMRAVLATTTMGLAVCAIAGHPHWYCHHMGLGETIGYGARVSMNNDTLYRNQTNELARAVYMELLGDPTLRMDPVAAVPGVTATAGPGRVSLSWTASPDANAGYHVYRSTSSAGPFVRVNSSLLTTTSFTETGLAAGSYTYMVRAIALTTNPSGSYFNPSQGVFATASVTGSPPVITVSVSKTTGGVKLSWNTAAGAVYRVWAATDLRAPVWTDVSGAISASSNTTTWTDANIDATPQRYYRISTP